MKTNFFKRSLAYVVDYFIISFLLVIITFTGITNSNDSYNKELNELKNQYSDVSEPDVFYEYLDKVFDITYRQNKSEVVNVSFSVILIFGYYVIFGYLNNGQTIGKKIFKIRVVNNEGNDRVRFISILIRSMIIYGLLTSIYNVIFIHIFDHKYFGWGNLIISSVDSILMFVSFAMVLYRKDGRGLHDILAKTNVVGEVK